MRKYVVKLKDRQTGLTPTIDIEFTSKLDAAKLVDTIKEYLAKYAELYNIMSFAERQKFLNNCKQYSWFCQVDSSYLLETDRNFHCALDDDTAKALQEKGKNIVNGINGHKSFTRFVFEDKKIYLPAICYTEKVQYFNVLDFKICK